MSEEMHEYFNDDGTPFNPNLMPRPSLCSTCKKDMNPKQEILCNLNRNDQEENIFICFSYEPNSDQIDGKAIIEEMTSYMNKNMVNGRILRNKIIPHHSGPKNQENE